MLSSKVKVNGKYLKLRFYINVYGRIKREALFFTFNITV